MDDARTWRIIVTRSGGDYFCYDSENRLTATDTVASCASPTATLDYDPAGRLSSYVARSGGKAVTTNFAYDGLDLIAEYKGSSLTADYVFGPAVDEPIVAYSSTGVRSWFASDERGSIVAITNASGGKTAINTYDEYGIPGSSNQGRFQYTGQVYLDEIGLGYYKNRIYSPTLGRFLQTDPIGYGDGLNIYAYTHNDPVNGYDPTGTQDGTVAQGTCEGGPMAGQACRAYEGSDPRYDPLTGNMGQYYYNSAGDIYFRSNGTNVSDYASLLGGGYQPDYGAAAESAAQYFHNASSPGNTTHLRYIKLTNWSYAHIYLGHYFHVFDDKSTFYAKYATYLGLQYIVGETIANTIGVPQGNGNINYTANLGFNVGTDLNGDPTSAVTVIVRPTGPDTGEVVTAYPKGP